MPYNIDNRLNDGRWVGLHHYRCFTVFFFTARFSLGVKPGGGVPYKNDFQMFTILRGMLVGGFQCLTCRNINMDIILQFRPVVDFRFTGIVQPAMFTLKFAKGNMTNKP